MLVDRVNAGKELIERIPNSVFVSGGTKLTERKEEYDEVATVNNKVLVCCQPLYNSSTLFSQ